MTSSRKKPGVVFWAAVVVVVLLIGYPLSFGPACWVATRSENPHSQLFINAYVPLVTAYSRCPLAIRTPFRRYIELFLPAGWEFEPFFHWHLFFDERSAAE